MNQAVLPLTLARFGRGGVLEGTISAHREGKICLTVDPPYATARAFLSHPKFEEMKPGTSCRVQIQTGDNILIEFGDQKIDTTVLKRGYVSMRLHDQLILTKTCAKCDVTLKDSDRRAIVEGELVMCEKCYKKGDYPGALCSWEIPPSQVVLTYSL